MRTIFVVWVLALTCCSLQEASPLPPLPELATAPLRVSTITRDSFSCSAVAIRKDWAMTAAHCRSSSMWVENLTVEAMHQSSPEVDALMLHVPGLQSKGATMAYHKPEVGDTALLVGWGCSEKHVDARATLAQVETVDELDITYNVRICDGDSGGPTFDLDGRLNGIVVRKVAENGHAVVRYVGELDF